MKLRGYKPLVNGLKIKHNLQSQTNDASNASEEAYAKVGYKWPDEEAE
jgi:hypothetical protein